ncbi:MAG: ACP S-malonyltransferase, partial [Deltaproteobacteria bacterium]|nr:ACP S-malonyltransferase [Deltaproteobacteria bacterium]
ALLTMSVATYRVLDEEEGIEPVACLGHSLGEYSALVASGALDFGQALHCVAKRAEFMAAAMPPDSGGMAAILCLDRKKVEEICRLAALDDVLEVANLNAPEQIVVSGHLRAIERAEPEFKKAGARRVIRLKVSAAFHTQLMRPAAEELSKVLAEVSFSKPRCPVLSNVTGMPHQESHAISDRLVEQVVSPVRWEDCLRWVLGQGVSRLVELGPGSVLTGLARRIDVTTECFPVSGVESIRNLSKSLRSERLS